MLKMGAGSADALIVLFGPAPAPVTRRNRRPAPSSPRPPSAPRRWARAALLATAAAVLGACAERADPAAPPAAAPVASPPGTCIPRPPASGGTLLGVELDWATDSARAYGDRLGVTPGVWGVTADFPLHEGAAAAVDDVVRQAAETKASVLLTLRPSAGLGAVTQVVADDLSTRLTAWNQVGVGILVQYAPEMNGTWVPWGGDPTAYLNSFAMVADAVHRAPGAGTVWAPSYGGGYPFPGGGFPVAPGTAAFAAVDTDHDGMLTGSDDPYAPYWPGDSKVDWVALGLRHWGNEYPWGENEVPEPGRFAALLTGTYQGTLGDQTAVPDFYGLYAEGRAKPLAVPGTGAYYRHGAGGASPVDVKSAWWRQVLDPSATARFPRLGLVQWQETSAPAGDVAGVVDWRVTTEPAVAVAFRAGLPAQIRQAQAAPCPGEPAHGG